MTSRRARSLRFLVPLVLAAVLAGEITGIALARTLAVPPAAAPSAAEAVAAATGPGADTVGAVGAAVARGVSGDPLSVRAADRQSRLDRQADAARRGVLVHTPRAVAAAVGPSRPAGSSRPSAGASATHRGTNHVWIPSLGVSKGIQSFPCSRNRPPDAGVYRWGCAGRNNVYLLSHAWSTFKPLHDAYVGGRLRKGMQVVYADGAGRVHTYAVIWWKVVAPTTAASWAWASLGSPGMTLQTCVGAKSQYRLMVRLTRVR